MKVVVGYDGSACSQTALADLARAGIPRGSEVVLLTAADVEIGVDQSGCEPRLIEEVTQSASRRVSRALDSLLEQRDAVEQMATVLRPRFPDWHIRPEARVGHAADAILTVAREMSADLICVGAHGRSSFGRLIFGSVSRHVMLHAPCSVRITRWCPPGTSDQLRMLIYAGSDPSKGVAVVAKALAQRAFPRATEMRLLVSEAIAGSAHLSDFLGCFAGQAITPTAYIDPRASRHTLQEAAANWHADCVLVPRVNSSPLFPDGLVVDSLLAHAHCSVEVVSAEQTLAHLQLKSEVLA